MPTFRRFLAVIFWSLVLGAGFSIPGWAQLPPTYYWDDPERVVPDGARFPSAVDNGKTLVSLWQENRSEGGWTQSFLTLSVRHEGNLAWSAPKRVLGPYTFAGTEAQFYSAVLTPAGTLWVAVLDEKGSVLVFRSDDEGTSFHQDDIITGTGTLLAPRLFLGAGDNPLLMVNQSDTKSFRIYTSKKAADGWTPLQLVTPEPTQNLSFQPTVVRAGNRLVLLYQTRLLGATPTYQIIRKDSTDNGVTWGPAVRLSDFRDEQADTPDAVDNERPTGRWFDGRLFVAWERRQGQNSPQIEVTSYGEDGKRTNQYLTDPGAMARNPQFFLFRKTLHLFWFDNGRINSTYDINASAYNPDGGWGTVEHLAQDTGDTALGQVGQAGDDLFFFYQKNFMKDPDVYRLGPDHFAAPPTLTALNFRTDTPVNNHDFRISVTVPRDPSGIVGFVGTVTQDPAGAPVHDLIHGLGELTQTVHVPDEGTWYYTAEVEDGAGNWSAPARIRLLLKTTPPGPVLFDPPATDSEGFLVSNTFRLSWKPTTTDAVSYAWRWNRVGDALTPALAAALKVPGPVMVPSTETDAGADNFEDGLWTLSVAAYDVAGNRGPVTSYFFRLNKFRPSTVISSVETDQDPFGRIQLVIHGRGFDAGGAIDHVYVSKETHPPFDLVLGPLKFHLASDRLVDGIRIEGLAEGTYRVGVGHPTRGMVFTGPVLKVGPTGTVKVGDYRFEDRTVWEFFGGVTVFFTAHALYFWTVILFLVLVFLGSLRLLAAALADRLELRRQVSDLFADNPDKWAQRARSLTMRTKTQGRSLTFKFTVSILGLTGSVILILALTLGYFLTENSQRTLGTALRQRTQVLMDSLVTSARVNFQTGDFGAFGLLPPLYSALGGEADFLTITGVCPPPPAPRQPGFSFLWASNDPDILKKINTTSVAPGVSVYSDQFESQLGKYLAELNAKVEAAVGADARAPVNPATTRRIKVKIDEVAGQALSYPAFDPEKLLDSKETKYLFYQPVLDYQRGDPNYIRGLIRIQVSSETIIKQIVASRNQLIVVTLVLALVALGLGLGGALFLARQTIKPINIIVEGVKTIRDAEDKEILANHVIDPKTKDELAVLAQAINQMTQGLVHAATANKDLLLGKTTQKTFIPLDTNSKGRKLTTGFLDLPEAEIFGYYEGAKGVSGDYYDFRQLDNKDGENPGSPWYGFIKCDVSGKGIVGALIMFTVASVVVNFFRNWTARKDSKDIQLKELVANINDLLESLRFQGRFAALNTGILNVKTGKIRLCHAGDNVVHIWRGKTQTFETTTLPMAPATGQIEDLMARSLYKHYDLVLEPGDTLLFYTDGIEESQSKFRDSDFNVIAFFDPSDPSTVTTPGSSKSVVGKSGREEEVKAIDNEPLHEPATPANPRMGTAASEGNERLNEIIDAFYNRRTYRLVKKYPARPAETYTFDFSTCDGSAREVITALVSIDRIFRLVPDPTATVSDKIKLDVIQKDFLEKHFVEYRKYFRGEGEKIAEKDEGPEDSEYVWFSYLKEDDQFDDLTLLAVRKK